MYLSKCQRNVYTFFTTEFKLRKQRFSEYDLHQRQQWFKRKCFNIELPVLSLLKFMKVLNYRQCNRRTRDTT
ncbi:hypothetical protein NECAME_08813 [Necator americanus]|uniref:Uncharacterized protein n=1 Tax=Necator americanus TaxID=51031 RepID=W2TH92_NECAM|nr:hypothetical protein NECAME_08813 [Necator americanus]ETN80964.1 hypothetical protein NECAME_08813 [Necator americanus]